MMGVASARPKRRRAWWISGMRMSRLRAGMVRSLGFRPAPMVKASFQEFQPSSKAR